MGVGRAFLHHGAAAGPFPQVPLSAQLGDDAEGVGAAEEEGLLGLG